MLSYTQDPPSKRALKQHFLDDQKGAFPPDTLNCVAHLILAIENPEEIMDIALEYLVTKLSASRADMGLLKPEDRFYKPSSIFYDKRTDPPQYAGVAFPNQVKVFQKTWRQRSPVICDNVNTNPLLFDSRKKFQAIQSESILFQRLSWNKTPVGMTCIDFTYEPHVWTPEEISFVESFSEIFLGPLLGISQYWHDSDKFHLIKKPTQSEMMAIKLAAKGYSYKQIANELGKSIRTVENQLRNARYTLDAANQAELISKCQIWL